MVYMRWKIRSKAGKPNQCALKLSANSPCNKWLIERPKPQPGHQFSKPKLASGQSVKWCVWLLLQAKSTRAASQNNISKLIAFRFFILLFLWFRGFCLGFVTAGLVLLDQPEIMPDECFILPEENVLILCLFNNKLNKPLLKLVVKCKRLALFLRLEYPRFNK